MERVLTLGFSRDLPVSTFRLQSPALTPCVPRRWFKGEVIYPILRLKPNIRSLHPCWHRQVADWALLSSFMAVPFIGPCVWLSVRPPPPAQQSEASDGTAQ
eukprot:3223124-Rhodomonas_salina.2